MEIRCCITCRYCVEYEEQSEEATVNHECRRRPPQVYGADGAAYTAYPGVRPEEWCGEWEAVEHEA